MLPIIPGMAMLIIQRMKVAEINPKSLLARFPKIKIATPSRTPTFDNAKDGTMVTVR